MMHLKHWARAGAWAFIFLMAVCATSNLIGAALNMRLEAYSVYGLVLVSGGCAGVIMRINGMQIEKSKDLLKPKAIIVWLPVLLGLLFSVIFTLTILGGLWLAMTFAIMNANRHDWEQDHLKDEREASRN